MSEVAEPSANASAATANGPIPIQVAGSKRKRGNETKFYAVRTGMKPGIYSTWAECLEQVTGYKNALFKSFPTYSEAETFVKHGLSGKPTPNPSKFYAVRRGHRRGVYTDWEKARQQIQGFPKARHKSFSTRAEAQAFVDDDDSPEPEPTKEDTPQGKGKPLAKKPKKGAEPKYAGEIDETIDPGYGPFPPLSLDAFDNKIVLNEDTGEINYKTAEQRSAVKMQATGLKPDAVLHIYTDGSTLRNGRIGAMGGIGVWFGPRDNRNLSEALPGIRQTNQRAELTAIRRALDIAPRDQPVLIHSDSKYGIMCCTEWFQSWRNNGWLTSQKKPVENRDLVEVILAKIDERMRFRATTKFEWVKGHATDEGNTAADALAFKAAREAASTDEAEAEMEAVGEAAAAANGDEEIP